MRLLSITVRNYRIHQNLTVTFEPGRNLIGGRNESGKSTLVQAAHRALFLRAKTGGKIQKEMVSTIHLGDPEVILHFEAAGRQWELEKRFAVSRGSTRLTSQGQVTLLDAEAESKLAELLKIEPAGGHGAASQLASLWAHLWVWQGSSGADPAAYATEHTDTLVQRLQKDGLGAVMQSAHDQRVAAHMAGLYDSLFTATGKPKAGSSPEVARENLEAAERALQLATESATRLHQAVQDHARAERDIAEAAAARPALLAQLAAIDQNIRQVEELRRQEIVQRQEQEHAAARRDQLAKAHTRILDLQQAHAATAQLLRPAEEKLAELAATEKSAQIRSETAARTLRESAARTREARLQHDLAAAIVSTLDKTAAHQRVLDRATTVEAIRSELNALQARLSPLPVLTGPNLARLRKLERDASHAQTTLEAMATGLEIIASPQPVLLDGIPLAPGATTILTDVGELKTSDGTCVRIHPGGGTSLADCRAQAETTRLALAAALLTHTVRDVEEAATILEQRQQLEPQITRLHLRWKDLGGETIATEIAHAAAEQESACAEAARRHALAGSDPTAHTITTLAEGNTHLAETRSTLAAAETNETTARQAAETAHDQWQTAIHSHQQHQNQITADRQNQRDLETQIRIHEENNGPATTRLQAIATAHEAEQLAASQLQATRQAVASLSPETLASDQQRLQRALSLQENRRRDAENQQLIARSRFTLDGSSDPETDVQTAHARAEAARETFASEHRRARAVAMLHHHFVASRDSINQSLVEPLAAKISGYLQCLFGHGTEARVNLSKSGIESLDLIRPGGHTFHFDSLSGGAKEQVAAAARLAMAEILAADHDGCLPVVFDDAFAYTDPERVQSLQRMLSLASLRGLQVILLTCTPNEYSAFGAHETRLP